MYKLRERLHFMGIGGIGMSGIAEILRLQGYTVSGCDTGAGSKTIEHLKEIGCQIFDCHDANHIHDADVLVYSSAINQKSPEVLAALEKGIPVIPRAIMLAELMRTKYSVAVSGAHGKTTTTSMISHILIEAQKNPTVIIGGVLKNIAANAQLGAGEFLVAEADESDRSLLYLNPTIAVVTNIDKEHLDTYKDIDDIKDTFKHFLARLPFYGKAILCIDDPHIRSILPLPHIGTVKYGFSPMADVRGVIVELTKMQSMFDVFVKKSEKIEAQKLGRFVVNMPGEHNVLNALAAISLALEFEVSVEKIAHALESFHGVERRFEFKGMFKGVEVFDDYGHHPTEIKNTLNIAYKRKQKKLHVIFQPHRYTRTEKLWEDFVTLFANHEGYVIDTLLMTDIYPASEAPIANITSKNLIDAIKAKNPVLCAEYCSSSDEVVKFIRNNVQEGDLLITIGAGKVNKIGESLVSST
ncbi:MAG: UDP-N-acetylmuramate--L-alanine ligase [bacterium]